MTRLSLRDNWLKLKDFRKITDHFRGIHRIYPRLIKKNWKITMRHWLDLETLGSWPIIPKNLPGHWSLKELGASTLKGLAACKCLRKLFCNLFFLVIYEYECWSQDVKTFNALLESSFSSELKRPQQLTDLLCCGILHMNMNLFCYMTH